MKKRERNIFYLLMFLPIIINLLAIIFLPPQIPMHYDSNNEITRWGSKYELFIFPFVSITYGAIMLGIERFASKMTESKQNRQSPIVGGIIGLIIFIIINLIFLFAAFSETKYLAF